MTTIATTAPQIPPTFDSRFDEADLLCAAGVLRDVLSDAAMTSALLAPRDERHSVPRARAGGRTGRPVPPTPP